MFAVKNISFAIADRKILDNISFQIGDRERIGFVGSNGAGKSTLLKIMEGLLHQDDGEITTAKHATIASVEQMMPHSDESVLEYTLEADKERSALLKSLEQEQQPEKISKALERLDDIDAYSAPSRAAKVLAGIGFDESSQNRPVNSFSGGWKMRLGLARALFLQPDYMLLDEPTNHLDFESTEWLTGYLENYPGSIVIVSHEKNLLNRVTNRTFHIHDGKVDFYGGNYETFLRTRAEKLSYIETERKKQDAYKDRMSALISRFRGVQSKARMVQSRIKTLDKLKDLPPPAFESTPSFNFATPASIGSPVIKLEDATAGYEGNAVIAKVNLSISNSDKIAFVGANGNGKSTLIKVIAGTLPLMHGTRLASNKLVIGYLPQDQVDELPDDSTPLYLASTLMPEDRPSIVRAKLAKYGIGEKIVESKIHTLSGGEKTRLALALISIPEPHLLLLDEPTNHLDIDSREALTLAINEFPGAVVLITHDSALIEAIANDVYAVEAGRLKRLDMDLNQYSKQVLRPSQKTIKQKPTKASSPR